MKIEVVEASPVEKSIIPGIRFKIKIELGRYENYRVAIADINGYLKTKDEKIIAEIKPEQLPGFSLYGDESVYDEEAIDETRRIYYASLIAFLDKLALKHIEENRKTDKKGDVHLFLDLKLRLIESNVCISHLSLLKKKEGPDIYYIYLIYKEGVAPETYKAPRGNLWILSGKQSANFLIIKDQGCGFWYKISSSDWIHDFAPKLGLGNIT